MRLLDSVVAHFAPHDCLGGCGREGQLLCEQCQTGLKSAVPRCYRCHRASENGQTCRSCRSSSDLFGLRAAVLYEGLAKDLVWKLKFAGARSAACEMALLMLPLIPSEGLLTYAPTASSRVRQRGFDQAELLARELSRLSGLPYAPLLARTNQTRQVGATRSQRAAQLAGSFRVINELSARHQHVIVIDDVTTTGMTLATAASLLKREGATRVEGVVFAES